MLMQDIIVPTAIATLTFVLLDRYFWGLNLGSNWKNYAIFSAVFFFGLFSIRYLISAFGKQNFD